MRTEAAKIIIERFRDNWAGLMPYATENNPVDKTEGQPWARLSIVWGKNDPATISTTQSRCLAILNLQVFHPEDDGTQAARAAADKLDEIFRFQMLALPFTPPKTGRVKFEGGCDGPTPAGVRQGYTQHNIRLEFTVEVEN